MADEVVPDGEVLAKALDDAAILAGGPLRAYGAIKAMLAEPVGTVPEILDRELAQQIQLFASDDFAEGVAAFAERRQPRFGQQPS